MSLISGITIKYQEVNLMNIGIDIGKSAVKYFSKNLKGMFPSAVSKGDLNQQFLSTQLPTDMIVSIPDFFDQQPLLVGTSAQAGLFNMVTMDEMKANTISAVLICAAVGLAMNSDVHDQVTACIGLPMSTFNMEKDVLKKQVSQIKKFTFNGKIVHVQLNPIILPEPVAVFMSGLLDDAGNIKNKELLNKNVAVVDLGHRTLNILLTVKGKIHDSVSVSTLTGVHPFIKKIINTVSSETGILNHQEQMALIEKITGGQPFICRGKYYSIDYFESIRLEYFNAVVSDVISTLRDYHYDQLVFAGGGVLWIKPLLTARFPDAMVLSDPRFACASGLYKYSLYKTNQIRKA